MNVEVSAQIGKRHGPTGGSRLERHHGDVIETEERLRFTFRVVPALYGVIPVESELFDILEAQVIDEAQ